MHQLMSRSVSETTPDPQIIGEPSKDQPKKKWKKTKHEKPSDPFEIKRTSC